MHSFTLLMCSVLQKYFHFLFFAAMMIVWAKLNKLKTDAGPKVWAVGSVACAYQLSSWLNSCTGSDGETSSSMRLEVQVQAMCRRMQDVLQSNFTILVTLPQAVLLLDHLGNWILGAYKGAVRTERQPKRQVLRVESLGFVRWRLKDWMSSTPILHWKN